MDAEPPSSGLFDAAAAVAPYVDTVGPIDVSLVSYK